MARDAKRLGFDPTGEGRRVTGRKLVPRVDWSRPDSPWEDGGRDACLTATSPTNGPGIRVVVGEQGE